MTDSDDYDDLDLRIAQAEQAEIVRGRPQHEWWDELDRLQSTGDMVAAESLLEEMRDAVERSGEITGWAIPFAPTQGLLALYLSQGDKESARAAVDQYLAAVEKHKKHEPEGGDSGVKRAKEWLEVLNRDGGN